MLDYLASIWPLISHAGIGAALITGLLAAAYFSPILKREFVYAAVFVFAILFVYAVGVHDEKVKRDAQEKALIKKVHDAVLDAYMNGTKDPYDDENL